MVVTAMRILVAGAIPAGAVEMLRRFGDRGWGSRQVVTLQQARDQLETYDFDVVLATETLCDGRGYDLSEPVARHSRTLLVGVALSESCLWLPVVERGVGVLGRSAPGSAALDALAGRDHSAPVNHAAAQVQRPEIRVGVKARSAAVKTYAVLEPAAAGRNAVGKRTARSIGKARRDCITLSDPTDCLLEAYDCVARRAYEHFIERGPRPGGELEDWLIAERELLLGFAINVENSTQFVYAMASIPGATAARIEVGSNRAGW